MIVRLIHIAICILIWILTLENLTAQNVAQEKKSREYENLIYSNQLNALMIDEIIIRNPKGRINIIGSDLEEVIDIKVFKPSNFSIYNRDSEQSKEIKTWISDNQIRIETTNIDAKNSRFIEDYIFEITIPKRLNLIAENSMGEIYIDNINSTLAIACSYGDLHLNRIKAKAKSRFKTYKGDLIINKYSGSIMAKTMHGNIRIDSLDADTRIKTSHGSILGKGISGSIICSAQFGNIDLELFEPEKVVNLVAETGNIILNSYTQKGIDLSMKGTGVNLVNAEGKFYGEQKTNFLQGKLQGGGIPVILSTSTGNAIYILKEPN